MAGPYQAPLTRVISTQVGAVGTAGNDLTTVLGVCAEDEVVSSITYIPTSTITGANTNSRTLAVVNKGNAAAGNTSVASTAYVSGVNATGLQENALTLSGTPANLNTSSGDVLVLTSTHVGSGITDPGGLVRVTLNRR